MNIILFGFGTAFIITSTTSMRWAIDTFYLFLSYCTIQLHLFIDATSSIHEARFTDSPLLIVIWTTLFICPCRSIQKSSCHKKEGHEAACEYTDAYFTMLFGAIQIVLSQIPNFHDISWLSELAAITSFAYSFIGMGLAIANLLGILINMWSSVWFITINRRVVVWKFLLD